MMKFRTMSRFVLIASVFLSGMTAARSQSSRAQWIAPPGTKAGSTGVFEFRKVVAFTKVPATLPLQVTGDNRFVLYVNGRRIGDGPARGDLAHWRYESFDIASALHVGDNVIAARVWSFGGLAPFAQNYIRPAFLLWSDPKDAAALNTDGSWSVRTESAWTYSTTSPRMKWRVGPNEAVDAAGYDWSWDVGGDNDAAWTLPLMLGTAKMSTELGSAAATEWELKRDALPPMEYSETSAGQMVRGKGDGPRMDAKPFAGTTIRASTHTSFLIDRGTETTAYPMLTVSGGAGASIRMTYAESLYTKDGMKGNRNDIAGKTVDPGLLHDDFIADGGKGRTFEPLWWRTWRYIQVDVDTLLQPVTIDSLTAHYSAYPFEQKGTFTASDPVLKDVFDVGWRTLRVDAHETFMDCPYWEQMQYVGDARIESLVSYVVGGDDRLGHQALWAFDDSAVKEGITQSRYPSQVRQLIPTFSLLWIGMLHDNWWYRPDAGIQKASLPLVRSTLDYFAGWQRADGLMGKLPISGGYFLWFFLDWAEGPGGFKIGVPPQDADGGSIPISLQYAQALRDAADLEDAYGEKSRAIADRAKAAKIVVAAYQTAWDAQRGLLADTPAKLRFSQQTNIVGVMTDAIPPAQQKGVLQVILKDELAGKPIYASVSDIVPSSYYFRFYLARAVDHAGMDDKYLQLLGPWRGMLKEGLTTWAEKPNTEIEDSRSDAHAWSSHPNYDLLTLVAGIRPSSAGFRTVTIEPHLGALTELKATMPHPAGVISVTYAMKGDALHATVVLPAGVEGNFVWGGKTIALHGGKREIDISAAR